MEKIKGCHFELCRETATPRSDSTFVAMTGITLKKRSALLVFIQLFISCTLHCSGQSDTTQKSGNGVYWTPRFGAGVQKSPYFELGISRLGLENKGLNFGSWCFYGAAEINHRQTPANSKFFYGLKSGFETTWGILGWAVEFKYVTDFNQGQLLFTPKAGLGLGFLNLFYGYNYPKKISGFPGPGHHQVSLVLNINEKIRKSEF